MTGKVGIMGDIISVVGISLTCTFRREGRWEWTSFPLGENKAEETVKIL
jgi:hypothetical protein